MCEDMDEGGELCYVGPDLLARERPDSWGRLREDAAKSMEDYWGCVGVVCAKCPAMVDGNKPWERYGVTVPSCAKAMQLDLVARAERMAGVSADA